MVDNFITELYVLAEQCQFGALKEELIRDRIVLGLRNKRLSEQLQLDPNLTLEKAINLVRQSESVKKQQSILHGAKKSDAAKVDRIPKGKSDFSKKRSDNKHKHKREEHNKSTPSQRCLGTPHSKQKCPARDSKCNKCLKNGH